MWQILPITSGPSSASDEGPNCLVDCHGLGFRSQSTGDGRLQLIDERFENRQFLLDRLPVVALCGKF